MPILRSGRHVAARTSRERQRSRPHQREQASWRVAAGRNKRAMQRIGAIVDQNLPSSVVNRAAGFVHQKIGSRKVPVVAVAADAKATSSVPCATRASRSASESTFGIVHKAAARLWRAVRASASGRRRVVPSKSAPGLPRSAVPLASRRRPRTATKSSSCTGAKIAATHRAAVLDQRDRDRPVRRGRPDRRACRRSDRRPRRRARASRARIVLGFLREPAAVGREPHQALAQEIVDRDVGLADRRAAVLASSSSAAVWNVLSASAPASRTAAASRGCQRRRRPQVPATVSPSSRTVGALVP